MATEATVERDGRADFDFDALGRVREVTIGKCDDGRATAGQVRCGCWGATIDARNARAAGADTAHAIRIRIAGFSVDACRACTAAAIDIRFSAVLRTIHARWSSASHHVVAEAAHAIAVHAARFAIDARWARSAAAIDVGFRAVFHGIRAGWHGARHHAIAIAAYAVAIHGARFAIDTIRACRTTAVGIRFIAIFRHVRAGWSCAEHHRIAETTRAIAVARTRIAVHAIAARRTTAIGIRFIAILEAVHARRSGAHIRHGIAEATLTIAIDVASFAVGTISRARAATIDIGFRAVFLRVRACWRGAHIARANLAQTIGAHSAYFAIGTSTAGSAAIDVRFRSILRHIAALSCLANMRLANIRYAIRIGIAFDTCASPITNFAPSFIACRARSNIRVSRHSIAARVLRTRLVVAQGVRIVVLHGNRAIAVARHHFAIASCLRTNRHTCTNVCLDTRALEAIHSNAFIGWSRAIHGHRADRTTATTTHSPAAHSATAHSAATHSSGSTAARRRR